MLRNTLQHPAIHRTPRHGPTGKLALAVGVAASVFAAAAPALAQDEVHDVAKGAPAIVDASGVRRAEITIKNKTGVDATDVTASIIDGKGVKIAAVDIQGTEKDFVDDNNDGLLGDGEDDTSYDNDDDPGTVVSSILMGGTKTGADKQIANDEERTIVIRFDGPTPDGAKIRVRLSTITDDGTHADMLSIAPIVPGGPGTPGGMGSATLDIGGASAQIATGITNVGDGPIGGIQFFDPGSEPFFPHWWPPRRVHAMGERHADWWLDGEDRLNLVFDRPVEPGETVEVGLSLAAPVYPRSEGSALVIASMPVPRCYADFDGDGELTIFDFLGFQNAFVSGDASADCTGDGVLNIFDFLCFQNAFAAGCP
ncbi:MAG: hypothetical protein NCW75_12470 [Phycisphaera sp.]|nr:MAG: hypothetical protein NCW75_12470 [Phycisphaera sp.]